jgi:hypothetical protein
MRPADDQGREQPRETPDRGDHQDRPGETGMFLSTSEAPQQQQAGREPEHVHEAVLVVDARRGGAAAGDAFRSDDHPQQA